MTGLKEDLIRAGYTGEDLTRVRATARSRNEYWADDNWLSREIYGALEKQKGGDNEHLEKKLAALNENRKSLGWVPQSAKYYR